jgi:hypothetical protein
MVDEQPWPRPKSLEPLRFEPQHLGMAEGRPITGALSVASRHYVAGQHLWSARHHARLCAELETERTGKSAFDIQHRAYAVTAVLSAVVFLEALVNETFQDAADGHASRIAPLDPRCIRLMGEFWNASEAGGRYVGILDKYQMALLFADRPRLDPGAGPYQDAKLLIGIRNRLVHFRPAFKTAGEEAKEEAQVKGKFAQNALMAGMGNPWFPDKCLGAGCARWSWKTSLYSRTSGRSGSASRGRIRRTTTAGQSRDHEPSVAWLMIVGPAPPRPSNSVSAVHSRS